MRVFAGFLLAVFCSVNTAWPQQLLVFPAVADEVPGEGDSLWVTVVRVVKKNPQDSVTIRRKWVCLSRGGFEDDPDQAPTWDLTGIGPDDRLLMLTGDGLLIGTDAKLGAVALEVWGGEVVAHSYVADVSLGFYLPFPTPFAYGMGQFIPAEQQLLSGASNIPWLPGCFASYCEPQDNQWGWDFMRSNIGILNPNPEPLTITGEVLVFDYQPIELDYETAAFVREVQPYQWIQFSWHANQDYYGSGFWGPYYPSGGFILNLVPDETLPYYAYASVVFSPDPDTGLTNFSDPMFLPAEPGYVPSFYDSPPKTGDIGKDQDHTRKRRE